MKDNRRMNTKTNLNHATRVLNFLKDNEGEGYVLSEIATATQINRFHVAEALVWLQNHGHVSKHKHNNAKTFYFFKVWSKTDQVKKVKK